MRGDEARGPPPSRKAKAVVSWSSGKDAALALYETVRTGELEVVGLLTTITENFDRVSMHGVRREVLAAQARAAGLPLVPVTIPFPCPNEAYERAMTEALVRLRADGVTSVVFGDLYLQDVRDYRVERLRGTGIEAVFPLWGRPTAALARTMIASGIEATLVCVDPRKLPRSFAGRRFDEALLAELPTGTDPCGENGEFHTCVTGGPMFRRPIETTPGPVVERDGFVFADLALARPDPGATPSAR